MMINDDDDDDDDGRLCYCSRLESGSPSTITDSSLLHAKAILDCNSGHSTNYGDGDDDDDDEDTDGDDGDDDDTDGDDNDDRFVAGGSGHSMLSKQCTRCRSSHFLKLYLVSNYNFL